MAQATWPQNISRVVASSPSITFHNLPAITLPPSSSYGFMGLAFEFPPVNNPEVHLTLQNVTRTANLKAFIIDFLCSAAFEPCHTDLQLLYLGCIKPFRVPSPYNCSSNTIENAAKDVKDYLDFLGTPPILLSGLAEPLLNRDTTAYKSFINIATQMAKSSGIKANTFESFEPRAVKAISKGLCIPNAPNPPVYYFGPLIAGNDLAIDEHECLRCLSSQPSQRVLFLCFVSVGLFNKEQLNEMNIRPNTS
ncbi:hypothetical protein RJ639_014959 [Escallonia herrerae]|uniref:Uncharacterized protein n=1 Tax=Escallonia herrerae TaxID=1293975 RepID=A0AA88VHT9_9ASTE|nr:hypothetical protein RJ639_014959 [Escallonia herrerae]